MKSSSPGEGLFLWVRSGELVKEEVEGAE